MAPRKASVSDFQFQWGSNYGMDGFQYALDYNSGNRDRSVMKDRQTAKNKLVLPGAATLQTPPLGDALFPGDSEEPSAVAEDEVFAKEAADLSDVGLLPTRALDAPIVDHSWFTMAEQDPARLPKNSKVTGLTELQQLWTARTNGNRRETLLDPRYAQPFKEAPSKTFPVHTLSKIVAQAMRRSASGLEIDKVLEEATLGLPAKAAQKVHLPLLRVREDHGLAGRVFIRASAYPGCHQGKWAREVQKTASAAHYVISKPECQGCPKNLESTCRTFGGKQIVASVPWEEAKEFYGPKLELSGRPIRKDLPPREALRLALASPTKRTRLTEPTAFHIQPDPLKGMTAKAALAELRNYRPKPVVLKTAAEALREKQIARVGEELSGLERQGALSGEVIAKLRSKLGEAPPLDILKAAKWMVQVGELKKGAYQGPTIRAALHSVLGGVSLKEANRRFDLALQKEAQKRTLVQYQKAASALGLWVRMGLLEQSKSEEILASGQDPQVMVAQAKELAKQASAKKGAYQGPTIRAALHSVLGGVSLKEANRRFDLALQKEAQKRTLVQYQKAASALGLWVRMGLLEQSKSEEILASGQDPQVMVAQAKELAKQASAKKRAFSGPQLLSAQEAQARTRFSSEEIQRNLAGAERARTAKQEELARGQLQRSARQSFRVLEMAVSNGVPRQELLGLARKIPQNQRELLRGELRGLFAKVSDKRPEISSRNYQGHVFKEAKPLLVQHQRREASKQEIQKAASETLILLNRGFAGSALVRALGPRHEGVWSKVQEVRKAHEGRAGHLYIAAEAHTNLGPVAGCEKGAAMYREVPVKVVLPAPQCEDCSFRGPGRSGTEGHCLKFARDLVSPERLRSLEPVRKSATQRLATAQDPGAGWFDSRGLEIPAEPRKAKQTSSDVELPLPSLENLP